MEQEFVRVGYYVNNEYEDPIPEGTYPEEINYDKIVRNVLSNKPRVTRIPIKWDTTDEIGTPPEVTEEEVTTEGFTGFSSNCSHPMQLECDL